MTLRLALRRNDGPVDDDDSVGPRLDPMVGGRGVRWRGGVGEFSGSDGGAAGGKVGCEMLASITSDICPLVSGSSTGSRRAS